MNILKIAFMGLGGGLIGYAVPPESFWMAMTGAIALIIGSKIEQIFNRGN